MTSLPFLEKVVLAFIVVVLVFYKLHFSTLNIEIGILACFYDHIPALK